MPVLPLVGSTSTVRPGSMQAVALSRLDHRQADPVLHAVGGVAEFELGDDLGGETRGHPVQSDEGGVADQLCDVTGDVHGILLMCDVRWTET